MPPQMPERIVELSFDSGGERCAAPQDELALPYGHLDL